MSLIYVCLGLLFAFQDTDQITNSPINDFPVADRFSEAIQKYNSVERSESELMFTQIIEELRARTEPLSLDENLVMTESLKFMGALNYPDQTEAYFEELIRFDPAYQLNVKDLPPKIIEVFDNLKLRLVGTIRISVTDMESGSALEDALLLIDERPMGSVFGEKVFSVFAGPRNIMVRCPNYDSFSQSIEVVAGQETPIRASVPRIASQVYVVTQPANCEVFLNDVAVGHSDGNAPIHYRSQVAAKGFSLGDVGGTILNDLAPGKYVLEMRKPCFRNRLFEFEIGEPRQVNFNPIFMEPAEAFINVSAATESSALVYLGTERIDFLPIENYRVCPGEYELRVTFTDGEYVKNISLKDGDSQTFIAEPLPSIVWFGLEDEREGTPPGDMEGWVTSLQKWNVRKVNPYDTTQVPINPFALLFDREEMTPEVATTLTKQVKADLYMAARVVRQKVVIRTVEVVFWTPLSKKIQRLAFDFREFDQFKELLAQLDAVPELTKPWLGIQTARLEGINGLKIMEVHQGGPLAGKVAVGELITSVNGNLLRGPEDIVNLRELTAVALEVGGRRLEELPIATIAEVPFSVEAAPQAMLARFEKMAHYHPDPLIRKSALFNQARFHLLLGDFKNAFDIFSTLTLDANHGINQGTLMFYQGLCFRRLNLAGEATSAFKGVLEYPNATLFNAYGPRAAFWAEAEINNPNQ